MANREPVHIHLDRIMKSQTVDEVWSLHVERMVEYGFDRLLYGGTRFQTNNLMGDMADALILLEGDQAFTDVYIGEELYLNSPLVEWAANNVGAISWRKIAEQIDFANLSENRRKLMALNANFGLLAGYTISLIDLDSHSKGVIGLVAKPGLDQIAVDSIWDEFGAEIETITNVFHLKIGTLPQHGQRRPLTSRQREALKWAGNGKTTRDIATIMSLSSATVEKHLRCARSALDVETTAHAVQKATSLNQLVI